jgi:hypothetical protein
VSDLKRVDVSAALRCFNMLRITIYATLIVIVTIGTAFAQNDLRDIRAGENSWRTEQEKKNDRAIDRAYQSTMKRLSDHERRSSDPWGDLRPAPQASNKGNNR